MNIVNPLKFQITIEENTDNIASIIMIAVKLM